MYTIYTHAYKNWGPLKCSKSWGLLCLCLGPAPVPKHIWPFGVSWDKPWYPQPRISHLTFCVMCQSFLHLYIIPFYFSSIICRKLGTRPTYLWVGCYWRSEVYLQRVIGIGLVLALYSVIQFCSTSSLPSFWLTSTVSLIFWIFSYTMMHRHWKSRWRFKWSCYLILKPTNIPFIGKKILIVQNKCLLSFRKFFCLPCFHPTYDLSVKNHILQLQHYEISPLFISVTNFIEYINIWWLYIIYVLYPQKFKWEFCRC